MNNIYEISCELEEIYNQLEENGGELTPELEEKLAITQDMFHNKVEGYAHVITELQGSIDTAKTEQKRLKEYIERKQKVIDKLSKVLIEAIEKFGNKKKSGVSYCDYGTGEISVRTTKAVDVNSNVVDEIANAVLLTVMDGRMTNQLDVVDRINIDTVKLFLNGNGEENSNSIVEDDINNTSIDLKISLPVEKLVDGEAYPIIRELAKYTSNLNVSGSVSKTELKQKLENDGTCAPHIGRLVYNKSLICK